MEMVNITINGRSVQVDKKLSLLEAIRSQGIKVPTLCYHPDLRPDGSCRLCVVEVKGVRSLVASCVYPVSEGMEVWTNTKRVLDARKTVVELLLANHPQDCLTCSRNMSCELQRVANELGVREIRVAGEKSESLPDLANPSLMRDPNKCIKCGRCVRMCGEVQSVNALGFADRGFETTVVPAFNMGLDKMACTYCGQCAKVCPTGAIVPKDDTQHVWKAINNPDLHVVVQTAPAVRVALGDALGLPAGSIVTGKMVAALRRIGFDKVFDTDFAADVTIMEEGTEFLNRLRNGGTLPLITSCSPGWINFAELFYSDLLDHLSTTKSPQQIFGALVKSFYAEKMELEPSQIYSVSIMPCTAKKAEASRPDINAGDIRDVDCVLTTAELAAMIKHAGIDFEHLPEESFDSPLGESTGAAVIFGVTGGVMEAALRTVVTEITGKQLEKLEFTAVRGMEGIKEAALQINDLTVKVAVASGLGNARQLMDKLRAGELDYHFIEIMACPGGCIGGGGQPKEAKPAAVRQARGQGLYEIDDTSAIRSSHENPDVQTLYKEWLGEPNGAKAHHLLHTHYHKQDRI